MVSDPENKAPGSGKSAISGNTALVRLESMSALSQSDSVNPPKLRFFRALQLFAIMFALVWLVSALLVSHYLIQEQLKESLNSSSNYVEGEVGHLLDALSQNLYRAEQLSKTLSFDQSVIKLAEFTNRHSNEYKDLPDKERYEAILKLLGANTVNLLFEQLAHSVDLYQVLLLDSAGYCVGSSRFTQANGCIGVNYRARDYYLKARDEGSGRQFAIGRVLPVPSFFFSTAIKKDNEFLGAVVVRQEIKQILGFLNHQKSLTFITGSDGVILSSSQPELVYSYVGSEFFPSLDLTQYQSIYHRDKMENLNLDQVVLPFGDFPFIKFQGKTYMLGHVKVEGGDFHIFILDNVEPAIASYYNSWKLAGIIVVLGLLLILMIERNLNHNQHRIAHLNALSEANKNLALLTDELYELSVTDALTGISNRRFFRARLQDEISRAQRRNNSLSVNNVELVRLSLLIIDIDEFKRINDKYGHPVGDQAIITMAKICADAVRQYDCVGRIGGEEFAVLLTDADKVQACEVAERIRSQCENQLIQFENFNFFQTCSIGIATLNAGDTADSLLSRADKALYEAKHAGRNRFICAD
ncbi:hypothetical protein GCM10011613_01630 [Cellvibrio zantedeschiae]|uniref:diguanylate cyclase n=1 Tax=Cellvibrio zantedeschiae TaxID=1237077 RepID=A0ABQ3ARL3_9GAMM|nr:sensor domain-containing diguanylate cyclase [Cellvibrio zantedeschiae]GGY61856.1 hypothetical protein GCM10011613_01630 [Cellvibrio zantedeschiae]